MVIKEVEIQDKKKDLFTKQIRTELELRKQQCRLVEQKLASIEKENSNTTQDSELIGYIQHLKGEIRRMGTELEVMEKEKENVSKNLEKAREAYGEAKKLILLKQTEMEQFESDWKEFVLGNSAEEQFNRLIISTEERELGTIFNCENVETRP